MLLPVASLRRHAVKQTTALNRQKADINRSVLRFDFKFSRDKHLLVSSGNQLDLRDKSHSRNTNPAMVYQGVTQHKTWNKLYRGRVVSAGYDKGDEPFYAVLLTIIPVLGC